MKIQQAKLVMDNFEVILEAKSSPQINPIICSLVYDKVNDTYKRVVSTIHHLTREVTFSFPSEIIPLEMVAHILGQASKRGWKINLNRI